MNFVLHIFFSGLIAFAPSPDGKQLTVLLVNGDGYHFADGTALEVHKPLLLARAGGCTGDCPTRDPAIAHFLFPDQPDEPALDSLAAALAAGGGWQLANSDLSLRAGDPGDKGLPAPLVLEAGARRAERRGLPTVPSTAREREDFDWVANLDQIYPAAGGLNPALLAAHPPKGLIAARLRLSSGRGFTYSLVRVGDNVKPIHFNAMGAEHAESPYARAVAGWVAAEIQVPDDAVEVVEESFDGSPRRSMKLSPLNLGPKAGRVVEMAILNVPALHPPSAPVPGESATSRTPAPGKHFELYFELTRTPPAKPMRPIPQLPDRPAGTTEREISWETLHPVADRTSALLDRLRLRPGSGRGTYDRVLCPMIQFSGGVP